MRRLLLPASLVLLSAACGGHATSAGPSGRVAHWAHVERLPKQAIPGARLFESAGCIACHTYAGSGGSNLHAPDLTSIGSRHLGIKFQIAHLKCPACAKPGSPMPPFRSLGRKRLRELAIFLEASKGIR